MKVAIAQVQVEHHESGFGISHASPRLSWRFASTTDRDWVQASYEIVVNRNGKEEQYKENSHDSVLVPWPSKPLTSRERATVKVRATGTDGSTTDWKETHIEVGLLERSEWKGDLISCPKRQVNEPKRPFRTWKDFRVDGEGKTARLYATAHGIYEATLNGKRIGDHVLAPGWQSYNNYLSYQIYDVSSLLVPGTNVLCAYVGEGWFATRLGRPGERNIWGDRLGFLGQLEIDGQVVVKTDASWTWADGPVIISEIYDGEKVDTGLDDDSWWKAKGSPVEVLDAPQAELVARDAPPVRRHLEIKAKEVITTTSGNKVLDFGQNLVGWVRIDRDFEGEGTITIRHAEVLEHGELGVRPLRTAKATDTIILGGKTKGWEPKFTFHGFRYAEISGVDVDILSFTAVVIVSDMRRTGTFHSSHSAINQLHSNVVWSMMGNFVSVPTDCPQRDERLGWTGDIQAFAPTANFLYDTAGFLGGWLRDVDLEQREHNGIPPEVVPHITMHGRPVRPMAIWADVVALTPWDLYTTFGDTKLLSKQWDSMALWLDKGVPRRSTGLWDHGAVQYGDWLDPRAPPQLPAHGLTDTHLAADAYLVYTTGVVAKIAEIIGNDAEAKRFGKAYDDLLREFRREYVTPNGRLMSDTQTAIALALRFGLIEGKQKEHATERLEHLVRWDAFKISTGFAGTPNILHALADNGLLHLAYRMLQEKDDPSWLYPVGMGATTIWERWNSMLPDGSINPGQMTSFNHYALGAVASFLHAVVGGLSPLEPGWRSALVKPQPGGTVASAKVDYDSPYGPYSVAWKLDREELKVKVEVPPNGSAKVVLPGVEETIGSGKREYSVKWAKNERWPPKLLPGPSSIQMPDEYIP